MTPTGRKPGEPQIQNLPGTPAYDLEMAEIRNPRFSAVDHAKVVAMFDAAGWTELEKQAHADQVARVKALSATLKKVLAELAERFGITPEEMAKLIARRLERRAKEKQ